MVSLRSSRSRSQAFNDSINTLNRSRPGQVEHDVFEGLPVRRWARQRTTISQTPKSESLEGSLLESQKLPELPMPRDSHLLTPMSRALLRAARAGCTYIRPVPKNAYDEEKEVKEEEGGGDNVPVYERTFVASKWGAIPRHMEPPEVEFLAKRRAGLPSLYGAAAATNEVIVNGVAQPPSQQPPMRKTKFKKIDPTTGTVSIYEAWVPEGHKVQGEINENEDLKEESGQVVTATPAPGTVVEGVGIVDQEGIVVAEPEASMVSRKRQPPPPKRKAKGPGRGRKKKVMFAPGGGVPVSQAEGVTFGDMGTPGTNGGHDGEEEDYDDDEDGEETGEEEGTAAGSKSPGPAVVSEDPTTATPASVTTAPEDTPRESQGPDSSTHTQSALLEVPPADANHNVGVSTSLGEIQSLSAPNDINALEPLGITDSLQANNEKNEQDQVHPPPPTEALSTTPPPEPATTVLTTSEGVTNITTTTAPAATATATLDTPATTRTEETTIPASGTEGAPTPTATAHPATTRTDSETVRFEDGEIDLLGSLEASLDRQSGQQPSWAIHQDSLKQDQPDAGSGNNPEPAGNNEEKPPS
ncbi:hypothetical protein VTO42DRAFT_1622 [Malbranchea cinnamomea]